MPVYACETRGPSSRTCHARLTLDRTSAGRLLAYRDAIDRLDATVPGFGSACFRDTTGVCLFGLYTNAKGDDYPSELDGADWRPEPTCGFTPSDEVVCLTATRGGVGWSAVIGDDEEFTDGLTWSQVEAAAAGRDPFAEENA